jgi:hypothetical protein
VSGPARDRWAEWLLKRRFGGDPEHQDSFLEGVITWRDRVLGNAAVKEGETLLDVGAGDGLIAFGAVDLVGEEGRKVRAVFENIQPLDADPMLNFDERDLFDLAENAGFAEVHLNYEASLVAVGAYFEVTGWNVFLRSAGNPKIPTLEEAMNEALTPEEIKDFTAHLRPLVENARRRGTSALAYLWAVK